MSTLTSTAPEGASAPRPTDPVGQPSAPGDGVTAPERYFWWLLSSLYITQFLGLAFFVVALVAILRSGGASLDRISLVYALGLFGAVKFLWAPIIDRFALRRLGHYRGWLLVMQLAFIAALLALARFDPLNDFPTVYLLCLVIAALSTTQDIAVDALACRMVPARQRGLANGLQTAGGLISFMIGGGLVLALYPQIGWAGAMLILAAANLVSLILLLAFREPAWPPTALRGRALLGRVWTLWRQPGGLRWLGLVALAPAAISLAYALITPMLVDAGWTIERIGLIVNVLGSLAGALVAVLTGWYINRVSRQRALRTAMICQVLSVAGVAAIALGATSNATAGAAVLVFFIFYNPTWAVLATLMMDRASPASAGTDYSVQWSAYVVFQMVASGLAMTLAERLGYLNVMGIALALSLVIVAAGFVYHPGEPTTAQP